LIATTTGPCQSFRVGQLKGENQTNRWGYGFLKISYFFPVFSEKEDHKKKFHFRTYKNPYREKNGGL
jgi:hypothetical protein